MLKKIIALTLLCSFTAQLFPQTPDSTLQTSNIKLQTSNSLSPEEAVRIALENNFDIRLIRSDAEIARLNNTKGNAGMLPTVNLVANENFTLSAFEQKLANGSEFKALGAPFNAMSTGVQLSWTLFDGRRMYIAKQRLEEMESLGQINLQNSVQQTTAAVLLGYYDIVRSRLLERSVEELISLSEERLRIAEARLAAGFAAQTDALTSGPSRARAPSRAPRASPAPTCRWRGDTLAKELKKCDSKYAFFSADESLPWEYGHMIAGAIVARGQGTRRSSTSSCWRRCPCRGRAVKTLIEK
jgi:hypothetical protein